MSASFLVLLGFFVLLQSEFSRGSRCCCNCTTLHCDAKNVSYRFHRDGSVLRIRKEGIHPPRTIYSPCRNGTTTAYLNCITCTGICYNHTNTSLYKCNLLNEAGESSSLAVVKDGFKRADGSNRKAVLCSKKSKETVLISLDNKIAEKVPFYNCNAIDKEPDDKPKGNFTQFYETVIEDIFSSMDF